MQWYALPAACVIVCAVIFILSMTGTMTLSIPVGVNQEKEIHQALYGAVSGHIEDTRWTAFGRIDVVAYGKHPERMDIYIDGTAGTPMYRFDGDVTRSQPALSEIRDAFPGYFPFPFLEDGEKDSMLVIGPGGGRDILIGEMAGVKHITAVEVNKGFVDIVRDYSDYNGGIYTTLPSVEIIIEEGRSFLKRHERLYDILFMSLPATNTSRSREGYALTENFLLTTDSLREYYEHLTAEGAFIVVTHGQIEVTRLLGLALTALSDSRVSEADVMKHIAVLGDGEYPVFILKKKPFDCDRAYAMYRAAGEKGYDLSSSFFPLGGATGFINRMLAGIAEGTYSFTAVADQVKEMGYDVSPVSDDNPFFFKYDVGLPRAVVTVTVTAFILLVVVSGLPLLSRGRKKRVGGTQRTVLIGIVVFMMLGMGFMLVEIPLIQLFGLFLGHPTVSIAVILFSLLVGSGAGSWSSSLWRTRQCRVAVAVMGFAVAALIGVYCLSLETVFQLFLGMSLMIRLGLSALLLLGLGFLLGFMFPLAVRLLKEGGEQNVIPWMWGINGISSVAGSSAALLIAIRYGFREALLVGACAYLIASAAALLSVVPSTVGAKHQT